MLTSEQIRAARALLRMEQTELAEISKVSVRTIARLELHRGPIRGGFQTVSRIKAALEDRGIVFSGEGILLEPKGKDEPR